jgi:hypothetical protein
VKSVMIIALGVGLVTTPALAQNAQGMLNGLLSGNQDQNKAVQDAYERGYQKGRQDEARMHSGGRQTGPGYGSSNYSGRNDPNDVPRNAVPYGTQSGMNGNRGDYSR